VKQPRCESERPPVARMGENRMARCIHAAATEVA
jgi:hypothetical protein